MREDMFKALDAKIMDICISTIDEVKEFVSIVSEYSCTTTLQSGKYMVDAKSILGVFSLDVSKPVKLIVEIGNNGIDDSAELCEAIDKFIVKY